MSTSSPSNSPDENPEDNAASHVPLKLSDIKRPILWAAIAMVIAIFIRAFALGRFGVIGIDGDDVMRFVQVRDYLNGQSWFDTNQLRLGLAGGTDMHWWYCQRRRLLCRYQPRGARAEIGTQCGYGLYACAACLFRCAILPL